MRSSHKLDPSIRGTATTSPAGQTPGKRTLTAQLAPEAQIDGSAGKDSLTGVAPGRHTLTAQLAPDTATASAVPAAPSAVPAAPSASPVPPEVMARVGAEFWHDRTGYRYRITPAGGFLLLASPDGKGVGKNVEFRHDNQYADAWKVVKDYVVGEASKGTIPPTVAPPTEAPPTEGPPTEAPAAPEDAGFLGTITDGLTAIGDAVQGAIDAGKQLLGGGLQIIEDAILRAIGSEPAPSPGDGVAPAPAEPAPGQPAPDVPVGEAPDPTAADIPALRQSTWYGTSFEELGVDAVYAAAQLIESTYGFGGPVTKVTEPTADDRKCGLSKGYYWFKADGSRAWSGSTKGGATQYVKFRPVGDSVYGSYVNPLSQYFADNPPGQRPAEVTVGGKTAPAPAAIQNLAVRNIPGSMACFATSAAMMAQAGVHAVGSDAYPELEGLISNETYREYTDAEKETFTNADGSVNEEKKAEIRREVTGVTMNAAKNAMARAYVDFETSNQRPVFAGISYTERNCNSDEKTDHWVVITGRAGEGQYTFNDPGDGSAGNSFVWDGQKLHQPTPNKDHADYLYVVAWIRPNQESLAEWNAHWAQKQGGDAGGAGGATPAGAPAAGAK